MQTIQEKEKKITGFFSRKFYYAFRALFHPVTRLLILLHVTPNMVTVLSMVFGAAAGFMFAQNRLWAGMVYGYFMAFADIVDGQLAKATGTESRFGGVLDSAVDRYTDGLTVEIHPLVNAEAIVTGRAGRLEIAAGNARPVDG